MPRVSVIIPTYNCSKFLGRALKTALAQSYTDYEVIIMDDGSTDDTKDVVARFGNAVRYFYQPNRGLSAARNAAISKSSGEFLAYLDADDMWHPQKLEKQIAFLDAHKECGFVHSETVVINEDDEVIHLRFNHETKRPVPQGHCVIDLLRTCHIQILTVVERRECLDRVGNFDERLFVAQDYFHWIMVAMHGMAIGYLDEPLGMYRWRTDSLFSNQRRVIEDFVRIFDILVEEKSVRLQEYQEAMHIVRDQLYTFRRDLAYIYRVEGQNGRAFRQIIRLILGRPLQPELYLDLLKACVPPSLYSRSSICAK